MIADVLPRPTREGSNYMSLSYILSVRTKQRGELVTSQVDRYSPFSFARRKKCPTGKPVRHLEQFLVHARGIVSLRTCVTTYSGGNNFFFSVLLRNARRPCFSVSFVSSLTSIQSLRWSNSLISETGLGVSYLRE